MNTLDQCVKMIVKVQLSLMTTASRQQALIYSADRKIMQEFPAHHALIKRMGGADKKYFNATYNDGELTLDNEVKEQSW